jgi:Spy/CpxP family protein refolding chaperone
MEKEARMNRSVLVTLLAFSFAVNVATAGSLIFFWAKAQASPVEISLGQKSMKSFLQDDLGLSPEQLSNISGLIEEKRPEIVELKRRFDLTRNEMKSLITADSLDVEAIRMKVGDINHLHGRIREITIGTVAKIAASLPPKAKKKFAQYIRSCGPGSGVCAPGKGKGPYGDVKIGR